MGGNSQAEAGHKCPSAAAIQAFSQTHVGSCKGKQSLSSRCSLGWDCTWIIASPCAIPTRDVCCGPRYPCYLCFLPLLPVLYTCTDNLWEALWEDKPIPHARRMFLLWPHSTTVPVTWNPSPIPRTHEACKRHFIDPYVSIPSLTDTLLKSFG